MYVYSINGTKNEWMDDNKNGRGNQIYASGNVYDGQWKDGQRNGKGKESNIYTFLTRIIREDF